MDAPISKEKQLLVTVACKVTKQLTVEGCTEDQAYEDPWEYVVDECETDQHDWDVIEVREMP
jgi:hypothetical protein